MKFLIGLLTIFGLVYCDVPGNLEDSLNDLNISGLPNNIDLKNVTNAIPIEKAEEVMKDKCRTNSGGEAAYEKAKEATAQAQECIKGIVDYQQLQEEIEEKKKSGDLDLVFKKYCRKSPQLKECVFKLATAYAPCLTPEEVSTQDTAINVTDSLIDFICFKDGDRIALFIAEGGPECINASNAKIKDCVESTFDIKIDGEILNMEQVPQFVLKSEECAKFTTLQKCVVKELEGCEQTTPANVVDSLFDFIRKYTPCQTFVEAETRKGSTASYNTLSSLAILTGLLLASYH